jgi:hypothetical protein
VVEDSDAAIADAMPDPRRFADGAPAEFDSRDHEAGTLGSDSDGGEVGLARESRRSTSGQRAAALIPALHPSQISRRTSELPNPCGALRVSRDPADAVRVTAIASPRRKRTGRNGS